MFIKIEKIISNKQLREFGLLIEFGFPILIGWLLLVFFGYDLRVWILGVGITITLVGFLIPKQLYFPYLFYREIWSNFNSLSMNIILSITYLLLIIPISLIAKILGYNPLKRKFNEANSYRETKHEHQIIFPQSEKNESKESERHLHSPNAGIRSYWCLLAPLYNVFPRKVL